MLTPVVRPSLLVSLALLLARCSLANNLFAGCYSALPQQAKPPPIGSGTAISSRVCTVCHCSPGGYCTLLNSQVACAGATINAYYNSTSTQCYCSDFTPPVQSLVSSTPNNDCGSSLENRVTRTSFTSRDPQCYQSAPVGVSAANIVGLSRLPDCLNLCRNGLTATYFGVTTSASDFAHESMIAFADRASLQGTDVPVSSHSLSAAQRRAARTATM
jgi:hypothetical protein